MTRSSLLGMIILLLGGMAQAADITTNQIGRLTSVGNSSTRTFHQYDAQGRAVAVQYVQDGQSRTFTTVYGYPQNPTTTNGPGTVIASETFPDGDRISYAYDASGLQVAMRSTFDATTQDVVRDLRTNARGQVTRLELGNGTVSTRSYLDTGNQAMALATILNASGQKVQEYGYAYDPNLNVIRVTDGVRSDQTAIYTYDSLNQLTAILNSFENVIEAYAYDAISNLTHKGSLVQAYGPLRPDGVKRAHAVASSAGISYAYDANGNAISIGSTVNLEWNAENMSTKVTAGSVLTEKSFVGENLWKKLDQGVPTYYLPRMRVENGKARKYYGTFAERFAGDNQVRFYHPDHLDSSSVMTDSGGNVIRRVSYFPWGQDRGVDGSFVPKLQFNFKEKDATGFYDYGARLYNPVTGRWLTPDTTLADGQNRYAYVGNNPLTRVDPTGHEWYKPKGAGRDGYAPRWFSEEEKPDANLWELETQEVYFGGNAHGWVILQAEGKWRDGYRSHDDAIRANNPPYVISQLDGILEVASYINLAQGASRLLAAGATWSASWLTTSLARREAQSQATAAVSRIGGPSAGGVVRQFTIAEEQVFFRVYTSNPQGYWVTAVRPSSPEWARGGLALPPSNRATFIQEVLVPAGTRLERSRALGIFGQRGGAEQFRLLEDIPKQNFGPGVPFNSTTFFRF